MNIFKNIRKKFKSKRGETLIETLSSLLIIVPAMVMLAGAIVTAARINHEARNSKAAEMPKFSSANEVSGTISFDGDISMTGASIKWCNETDSVYYYFR